MSRPAIVLQRQMIRFLKGILTAWEEYLSSMEDQTMT